MTISSITITAEASKAYQKYCVALTAENLNDGDIDTLKNIAISESLKGIDELAGNVGQADVKTTVQTNQYNSAPKQTNYTNNNASYRRAPVQAQPQNYSQPATGYNTNQDTRANRPVSEKQINYIRSLGWTGPMPNNFLEADELLKRLKAERGIN